MADQSGWCLQTRASRSRYYSRPLSPFILDPLDNDGRRHAAGGAHRHQAALEIAPLQFIEHGADQDRTGCTDRVPERDRTTIDIDLVAIVLEVADEFFS